LTGTPITRLGLQFTSFAFPGVSDGDLFGLLTRCARTAEDAGFDSLWTMDHVHQIGSLGGQDEPILEAYTTLAAFAAVTSTARLGVLVTAAGLRPPALLAKMVTTIDVISRGRAVLGVGAGWYEEEFAAYGMPFPPIRERLQRLEDTVRICRAMFTVDVATLAGRHQAVAEARNIPRPVTDGGPPIMIGGSGERRLIPMIARLGDACNFFGGPATVRHKIEVLEQACVAVDRDPATITKTWLGRVIVADSEQRLQADLELLSRQLRVSVAAAKAFALAGFPGEVAEQARRYRESGVDGILVSLNDASDLEHLARVGAVLTEALAD
jgi:F420-dependent oxidoreductase-like protein